MFESRQSEIVKRLVQEVLVNNTEYEGVPDDTWIEFEDLPRLAQSKIIVLRILANRLLYSHVSNDAAMPIFKLFRRILASEGRLASEEYNF